MGLPGALIAGPLLGLDPSYFFTTVYDWGSVMPSLLCRFAAFNLLLRWWQKRKLRDFFLASFFFGMGFFNKVDFVVILFGSGLALLITHRQEMSLAIRATTLGKFALGGLGFLVAAAPMVLCLGNIFRDVTSARAPYATPELAIKVHTALAMYDGSYFWRLMNVGGRFDQMFAINPAVWTPFGLGVLLGSLFLAAQVFRRFHTQSEWRLQAFLVLTAAFETLGFLMLPLANRIHHALLVYPFPHLIITAALVQFWPTGSATRISRSLRRALVVGFALVLISGHLLAIRKTEGLVRATGGRGWWANALSDLCSEVKGRADLTIVSLDWGFNEQLLFLTDGPHLSEPFRYLAPGDDLQLTESPTNIYLVHSPAYTMFRFGPDFWRRIQARNSSKVMILTYRDRENEIAFYAIRFRPN